MAVKRFLDIEVDVSKLERARRAVIHLDTLNKNMLKTSKEQLSAMKGMLSSLDKMLARERESLEVERKKSAALKAQKKMLDDLSKARQEIARRDAREKAKADAESVARKQELRRPKMSALEQFQRYKGMSGGFSRMAESIETRGERELFSFDQSIAEKQSEERSAKERYEASKKRFEAAKAAGTFDPASGAYRYSEEQREALKKAAIEQEQARQGVKEAEAGTRSAEEAKAQKQGEISSAAGKYRAMAAAASKVDAVFRKLSASIVNLLTSPFRQLHSAIKETVTAMLDFKTGVATYSAATSLITNAAAREQQLKYGLTASKNYAFTQAKAMLGIQSDEDLMYMNANQRDRLLGYMEKYSSWYDELETSGVLQDIQEMQLEFQELRQELSMEFLKWIAENKDTIMACVKGIFEVLRWIGDSVLAIMRFFGAGSSSASYSAAEASDRVGNNNVSKVTNVTINANTTNNATGVLSSQDALDKFNEENWSKLAKQVVGAIGG